MPCYLFTYHAYGSWLPDQARGFVKRGEGIQPTNHRLAASYAQNLEHRITNFTEPVQRILIDSMLEACSCQACRCHFIATESTHVHVLVSWSGDRTWETVRRQLRYNATRALNKRFGRQNWFAKSPSRRQVKDHRHFNHLTSLYLPSHRGLKWREADGHFK